MAGEQLAAVRAHPAVIASVVFAAVMVALCALVAIAYMLGWVPPKAPARPAIAEAPRKAPANTDAANLGLLPGETLVVAPEPPAASIPKPAPPMPERKTPAPTTPSYSQPAAPPPSTTPKSPFTLPQPSAPPPAPAIAKLPSRAAPAAPVYRRDDPADLPLRSYERSYRTVCVNCGTVAAIRPYGDDWEVAVRFEDGTSETLRYPERPRIRVGQRVTLEDGRLVPE